MWSGKKNLKEKKQRAPKENNKFYPSPKKRSPQEHMSLKMFEIGWPVHLQVLKKKNYIKDKKRNFG